MVDEAEIQRAWLGFRAAVHGATRSQHGSLRLSCRQNRYATGIDGIRHKLHHHANNHWQGFPIIRHYQYDDHFSVFPFETDVSKVLCVFLSSCRSFVHLSFQIFAISNRTNCTIWPMLKRTPRFSPSIRYTMTMTTITRVRVMRNEMSVTAARRGKKASLNLLASGTRAWLARE